MSAPDANGWRPIETAPKDERILVAYRDGDTWFVQDAWWDAEFSSCGWNDDENSPFFVGAWTNGEVQSWGFEENQSIEPTHWQPLPNPPVAP